MSKKSLIPRVEGVPILADKKRSKVLDEQAIGHYKSAEDSFLKMTETLYEIASDQHFKNLGFDRFEEYVEARFGWRERKGWYFVAIQKKLVVEGKVSKKDLEEIGWAKAGDLTRLPPAELEPGKIEKWMDKAKTTGRAELLGEVQEAKIASGEKVKSPLFTRMLFSFAKEQLKNVKLALDIAKKISGSDSVSHNLDMICLSFLADRMEEAGVKLNTVLDAVKRVYEVEVVAVKIKGKEDVVIYGGAFAKKYGID